MSERKVLNKYYPPDFDPSKIPRLHLSRERQYTVRLMAPWNMKCKTCGEYIYKGKKFNARKETVQGEEYLGIKVFRFYIKCTRCLAEITFKTDPQNADYSVEHGATRNFQALKLAEEQAEREQKELEEEESSNPMKLLEKRTKQSKQEMDMMETLEEMRELNQRHANIDHTQMLDQHKGLEQRIVELQEEEDEKLIRSVFGKDENDKVIKRIVDDDESSDDEHGSVYSASAHTSRATDLLTDAAVIPPNKKAKVGDSAVSTVALSRSKISTLIKVKPRKDDSATAKHVGSAVQIKTSTATLHNRTVEYAKPAMLVKPDTKSQPNISAQEKGVNSSTTDGLKAPLPDETPCQLPLEKINVSNSAVVGRLVKTAGFNMLGAYSDSDSQSE